MFDEFKKLIENHTIKECSEILGMSVSKIYYEFGDFLRERRETADRELYEGIKSDAESGILKCEIVKRHRTSLTRIKKLVRKYGEIEFVKDENRNSEILMLYEMGEKQAVIARRFGLSRERVRQILQNKPKENKNEKNRTECRSTGCQS